MIQATITYTVKFLGAGTVLPGSGFGAAGIDRGVARTHRGRQGSLPYIPGSHIRGVVRERVEQLARLVLGESAVRTGVHQEQAMKPDLSDPVARLFVSANRPGMVTFEDLLEAPAEKGEGTGAVVEVRARVSIDRRTGTQRENRLFDHESWYPRAIDGKGRRVLSGRIRAWLEDEENARFDLALLVGGLKLVDGLGGGRSAGLGRCEVVVERVTMAGQEIPVEELLQELGPEEAR